MVEEGNADKRTPERGEEAERGDRTSWITGGGEADEGAAASVEVLGG